MVDDGEGHGRANPTRAVLPAGKMGVAEPARNGHNRRTMQQRFFFAEWYFAGRSPA